METTFQFDTALVTGGAGFIGSHLACALLDHGVSVIVLDNLETNTSESVPTEATLKDADVRNTAELEAAVEAADVVFHHAAIVSVTRSVEDPLECHHVNTEATLQLLELARQHDVRVIIASSSAVYGNPVYTPIDERHPLQPTSPYGIDKATIDQYARRYHDLYGVDTVVLRYFNAFGPGQEAGPYSGVISIFADQARNGDPITIDGDGTQTRDFVHVSDIVAANLQAATTDHVGEAFNIGTGQATQITELAETIREIYDSDSALTHTDPRPGDIEHSVADISKAETLLDYAPTIGLREGIASLREPEEGD